MPFPANLEQLEAAGYVFARSEECPVCREPVEIFTTPGKREIAMDPMCCLNRPAGRHYETCNNRTNTVAPPPVVPVPQPSPEPQTPHSGAAGATVAMHGVTDPNHQLIAVGWSDGTLVCQFKTAKWSYAGVPEAEYLKMRKNPFAYRIFTTNIKGKFTATKLN